MPSHIPVGIARLAHVRKLRATTLDDTHEATIGELLRKGYVKFHGLVLVLVVLEELCATVHFSRVEVDFIFLGELVLEL